MPPETQISPGTQTTTPVKNQRRLRLPGGWRTVSLLLLITVAVIIWFWKPWDPLPKAGDRTITVRGTATVKAEPDEYIFYPYYQVTNADKQAAIKQLSDKSNQIVIELKKLGVADKDIQVDSSGYSDDFYRTDDEQERNIYFMSLTVFVNSKDRAQKVQDYLLTTSPSGQVTPEGTFSESRQKQLEAEARDKAEKDARTRADQSAKNLKFKVGRVKSLEDTGFQDYYGFVGGELDSAAPQDSSLGSRLVLQPGEEELSYFVKVVYYIR